MFVREAEEKSPPLATTMGLKFALAASVLLTLGIGLYPQPFLDMAKLSDSLFK
jgi:NADH:ubiquinone oxidoreductase subunit 2 (subunit N)